MNLTQGIRMALRSLSANKLRASLTMLGIIIGTGAVIALVSIGQGAQLFITEQIQSIGSNLIFVFPGVFDDHGPRSVRNVAPLTRQDADALNDAGQAPHVVAVAPAIDRRGTVAYQSESVDVSITGSTAELEYVRSFAVDYGEFFTSGEETASARVALLGADPAQTLFGEPSLALGATVRINRVPFKVVGVLEKKGGQGFGGGSADNIAIIPLSTMQRRLFSGRYAGSQAQQIDTIYVSAVDEDSIDMAIEEMTWILRDRHGVDFEEDDFSIASQEDILGVMGQVTGVFTIFLGFIAGISLLVGGIGIMNIMLVSVTERTREIGIRKAVGAKRGHILWQFLIESVVLSIIGGLVGIGFGWVVALIVNSLDAFTTYVSAQAVVLAVSFSLVVGLFFGIYPASRAANLSPIDALRYE